MIDVSWKILLMVAVACLIGIATTATVPPILAQTSSGDGSNDNNDDVGNSGSGNGNGNSNSANNDGDDDDDDNKDKTSSNDSNSNSSNNNNSSGESDDDDNKADSISDEAVQPGQQQQPELPQSQPQRFPQTSQPPLSSSGQSPLPEPPLQPQQPSLPASPSSSQGQPPLQAPSSLQQLLPGQQQEAAQTGQPSTQQPLSSSSPQDDDGDGSDNAVAPVGDGIGIVDSLAGSGSAAAGSSGDPAAASPSLAQTGQVPAAPSAGAIINQVGEEEGVPLASARQVSDEVSISDQPPVAAKTPGAPDTAERDLSDDIELDDSATPQVQEGAASASRSVSDALLVRDGASAQLLEGPSTSASRGVSDSLALGDSAAPAHSPATVAPQPAAPSAGGGSSSPPAPVPQQPAPSAPSAGSGGGGGGSPGPSQQDSGSSAVGGNADNNSSPPAARHKRVSLGSSLRVVDNIAISGVVVPPAPPEISITSGELEVLPGSPAEITFHSTTAGSYRLEVKDGSGTPVSSLTGSMRAGANSVEWDGTNSSGRPVPGGTYSYYITAKGTGGTRQAPPQGDGTIVVATDLAQPGSTLPAVDPVYLAVLAAVIAAGAGSALMLMFRRKKRLILYLPAAASEVVDDIRRKFPDAVVEDYVDPGRPGQYKGVIIRNPEGADEGWLADVADKAKSLSGADSVSMFYRGKQQIL